MRGEVEKTLMLYLPEENNTVHYHGDNDQVLMLQEFVEHGKFFPCDGPDCYITLNGNLLIIEHFQFTCSKKNQKGDVQNLELARIDRHGYGISYREKIKLPSSGNHYLSNVISSFDKHYQKIQRYIEKCLSLFNDVSESDIIICFFIDDVSIVGSSYLDKSSGALYRGNIADCMEFLTHFRDHPRVNWVLSGSSRDAKDHQVWFISQKYIDEYIKHALSYSDKHFPYDEVHVIQEFYPSCGR